MSQIDAKPSELIKVVGIFSAMGGIRKKVLTTGMEAKDMSNVNDSQAKMVTYGSELNEQLADVDAEGDTQNEMPEKHIQLFLDPEVSSRSKLMEEVADVDADEDKDNDEPEFYVRFLFDPELPEVNLNEYVIAEIGNFLNYKDLQSLRRVDKLWSAGITSLFARKSVFVMESGEIAEEEMEAVENAAKTLSPKGLTAMKITLWKKFGFEAQPEHFNELLHKLSPALKSFELLCISEKPSFLPRATIQFPLLTSLNIDDRTPSEKNTRRLFSSFNASAPNLTSLFVENLTPGVLAPLRANDGSRKLSLAPKLKSLSVSSPLSFKELGTLVNFPQNWERLVIVFFAQDAGDVQLLSQLLEANSASLLQLDLIFGMDRRFSATLQFPKSFAKLQKLELGIIDSQMDDVSFGPVPIKYSTSFPALTELKVAFSLGSDTALDLWDFLFPPQVFKGLKELKLEILGEYDYEEFLGDEGIDQNWAVAMFPNAELKIT